MKTLMLCLVTLILAAPATGQPMGGEYYVGPGQDFATLTDARVAIETRGANADITLWLSAEEYDESTGEDFPLVYKFWFEAYGVTLKPLPGVVATISSTSGLVFDVGGRALTIDGAGGGLTIINGTDDGSSTIRVDFISSGLCLKNLDIQGNGDWVVVESGGIAGERPEHTLVENCRIGPVVGSIGRPSSAVFTTSVSATYRYNRIEDFDNTGIDAYNVEHLSVEGNTITSGGSGGSFLFGISSYISRSLSIVANQIAFRNSGTAIAVYYPEYDTTVVINNMVSSEGARGIECVTSTGPTDTASILLLMNSVETRGTQTGVGETECLSIAGPAHWELTDNIFVNSRVNAGGNGIHSVIRVTDAGAENSHSDGVPDGRLKLPAPPINSFASISSDHNDLYTPNTYLGWYNGILVNTLEDWRTLTGTEQSSVSKPVSFAEPDSGDLHLAGESMADPDLHGIPIAGVDTDIDGELRSPTEPFMGADEPVITAVTPFGPAVPRSFNIEQNYPNPFNPTTTIRYSLAEAAFVTLEVYNILGERVVVLAQGPREAGDHQVRFDAAEIPSGIYVYRLQAGAFVQTRKLIVLK